MDIEQDYSPLYNGFGQLQGYAFIAYKNTSRSNQLKKTKAGLRIPDDAYLDGICVFESGKKPDELTDDEFFKIVSGRPITLNGVTCDNIYYNRIPSDKGSVTIMPAPTGKKGINVYKVIFEIVYGVVQRRVAIRKDLAMEEFPVIKAGFINPYWKMNEPVSYQRIADQIGKNPGLKFEYYDGSAYDLSDLSFDNLIIRYIVMENEAEGEVSDIHDGDVIKDPNWAGHIDVYFYYALGEYTSEEAKVLLYLDDSGLTLSRIELSNAKPLNYDGHILRYGTSDTYDKILADDTELKGYDSSGNEALKVVGKDRIRSVITDMSRFGGKPTAQDVLDYQANGKVTLSVATKYGAPFTAHYLLEYDGDFIKPPDGAATIDPRSLKPVDGTLSDSHNYGFVDGEDPVNPMRFLATAFRIQNYYYNCLDYVEITADVRPPTEIVPPWKPTDPWKPPIITDPNPPIVTNSTTLAADATDAPLFPNKRYPQKTSRKVLYGAVAVDSVTYDGKERKDIDPRDFNEELKRVDIRFHHATDKGASVPGELAVLVAHRGKSGIVASGTDATRYYLSSNNLFKAPDGVRFLWRYNDGETAEMTAEEVARLEYSETVSRNVLVPGQTRNFRSDTPTLSITVSIIEGGKTYTGTYNANFERDRITALEILRQDPPPRFFLGNRPSNFRKVGKVKATFASLGDDGGPRVDNDFQGYEIMNPEKPVMDAKALASLEVRVTNSDIDDGVPLSLPTKDRLEFAKPSIMESRCALSEFQTKYINKVSKVNFGKEAVKANIVYGHDSTVDYEESVAYDDGRCEVSVWHNLDEDQRMDIALDGGEKSLTDVDMGKDMFFDCLFRFVVTDVFDTTRTVTLEQPFQIVAITSIKAISIDRNTLTFSNPANSTDIRELNYTIGQRFLYPRDGEGTELRDDTTANIYYENEAVSGGVLSYQARLDSGLEAIRIDPAPGTVLNKLGNQTVRVVSVFDSSVYAEYTIKVSPRDFSDNTETDELKAVWFASSSIPKDLKDMGGNAVTLPEAKRGIFLLLPANYVEKRGHNAAKPNWDGRAYGYLHNVFDKSRNSKVVLFQDYFPPVMGESNITVKFPVWVEGNADLINKCSFGHLFGNNNAKNRLFVSGNPDHVNRDWHTGATDSDTSGDFSYFADTSWQDYGQTDNSVIGYDIVSTDKMVVLKTRSYKEPSVYYRTSTLLTALDASGSAVKGVDGSTLAQEAYPLSIGNIGPGAYNPQGIANLNGDTLFISGDNVVAGLDVDGQIGDSMRAANTRSFFIDPDLKQRDLSDATVWSDGSRLWLVLPDCVYSTDYRTLNAETRQYEWFKEDLRGISCLGNVGGRMVFGREDGSLCFLEGDSYSDEDVIYPLEGQVNVYPLTEMITLDNDVLARMRGHDGYCLDIRDENDGDEGVFQVVCKASQWFDGDRKAPVNFSPDGKGLVMNTENALYRDAIAKIARVLGIESEVLFKDIEQDERGKLRANHPYRLVLDQGLENTDEVAQYPYRILDGATDTVSLEGVSSFTIVKRVKGMVSFETVSDQEGNVYPKPYNGSNLRIVDENGDPIDVESASGFQKVEVRSPVVMRNTVRAYYVTAPNPLGSLGYSKTVWSMTMTAEPGKENDLKVGIATNRKQVDRAIDIATGRQGRELDYSSLDFNKLYLGKSVIPGKYTVFRPIYPLPFVCLGFSSDMDMPSRLTPFQYTYSTSGPSFGQGGNI